VRLPKPLAARSSDRGFATVSESTPEARAAARRNWQAHVYRLGEEPPGDDLVMDVGRR
jgi:hypothetical protein